MDPYVEEVLAKMVGQAGVEAAKHNERLLGRILEASGHPERVRALLPELHGAIGRMDTGCLIVHTLLLSLSLLARPHKEGRQP